MRVCIESGSTYKELEQNLNEEIENLETEDFRIIDIKYFKDNDTLCAAIMWE